MKNKSKQRKRKDKTKHSQSSADELPPDLGDECLSEDKDIDDEFTLSLPKFHFMEFVGLDGFDPQSCSWDSSCESDEVCQCHCENGYEDSYSKCTTANSPRKEESSSKRRRKKHCHNNPDKHSEKHYAGDRHPAVGTACPTCPNNQCSYRLDRPGGENVKFPPINNNTNTNNSTNNSCNNNSSHNPIAYEDFHRGGGGCSRIVFDYPSFSRDEMITKMDRIRAFGGLRNLNSRLHTGRPYNNNNGNSLPPLVDVRSATSVPDHYDPNEGILRRNYLAYKMARPSIGQLTSGRAPLPFIPWKGRSRFRVNTSQSQQGIHNLTNDSNHASRSSVRKCGGGGYATSPIRARKSCPSLKPFRF